MFKEYQLTFSDNVSKFIKQVYSGKKNILEYGSGGSTLLGAKNNCTMIAAETSASWLVELIGVSVENNYSGKIIPIWTDIGPTKEWVILSIIMNLRNG